MLWQGEQRNHFEHTIGGIDQHNDPPCGKFGIEAGDVPAQSWIAHGWKSCCHGY